MYLSGVRLGVSLRKDTKRKYVLLIATKSITFSLSLSQKEKPRWSQVMSSSKTPIQHEDSFMFQDETRASPTGFVSF